MSHQTIIGITGLAGSGKDTVRAILEQEHHCHGLAFADPMRDMLMALLTSNGIDTGYMTDRAMKEQIIPALGVSYRQMAQTLGTEWGRHQLGQDFWVKIAAAHIRDIGWDLHTPTSFVVSDVRFQNEAKWIRNAGGVIWQVVREEAAPVRDHVSECTSVGIQPFLTLHNNATIDDLRASVHDAFTESVLFIHAAKAEVAQRPPEFKPCKLTGGCTCDGMAECAGA